MDSSFGEAGGGGRPSQQQQRAAPSPHPAVRPQVDASMDSSFGGDGDGGRHGRPSQHRTAAPAPRPTVTRPQAPVAGGRFPAPDAPYRRGDDAGDSYDDDGYSQDEYSGEIERTSGPPARGGSGGGSRGGGGGGGRPLGAAQRPSAVPGRLAVGGGYGAPPPPGVRDSYDSRYSQDEFGDAGGGGAGGDGAYSDDAWEGQVQGKR